MPNAQREERQQNSPARNTKRLPKRWLNHRHEKRRKKQRYGRKDCALAGQVLSPVILENLVYHAIPTGLGRTRSLRMWIVRMQDRISVALLGKLLIVKRAFLRID